MRVIVTIHLAVLLSLSLTSCVKTLYGSQNAKGGYNEVQISEDVFEVSVFGNAFTGRNSIRDYFLYRASELTLEHGSKYFVIYEDASERQEVSLLGVIPTKESFGIIEVSGNKYSNTGLIKIFSEKPENVRIFYDAELIKSQLESEIKESYGKKQSDS